MGHGVFAVFVLLFFSLDTVVYHTVSFTYGLLYTAFQIMELSPLFMFMYDSVDSFVLFRQIQLTTHEDEILLIIDVNRLCRPHKDCEK